MVSERQWKIVASPIFTERCNAMSTCYTIQVTMPREQDVECIAKFNLGRNKTVAYNVFGKLKGNRDINENDPLRMEFIETQNELPMSIDFISCTLAEIGENSKIIIKELFKSSLSLTD